MNIYFLTFGPLDFPPLPSTTRNSSIFFKLEPFSCWLFEYNSHLTSRKPPRTLIHNWFANFIYSLFILPWNPPPFSSKLRKKYLESSKIVFEAWLPELFSSGRLRIWSIFSCKDIWKISTPWKCRDQCEPLHPLSTFNFMKNDPDFRKAITTTAMCCLRRLPHLNTGKNHFCWGFRQIVQGRALTPQQQHRWKSFISHTSRTGCI